MAEGLSHKHLYLKLSCSQFISELGKGMSDDVTAFEGHI